MSVDEGTFQLLVDMGIEAPLARAAAQRFSNGDAAVNWCFGEGQNWKPSGDDLPMYNETRTSSVASSDSNGIYNQGTKEAPLNLTDNGDDEDQLQKALAMSRDQIDEDDKRAERERSVRASGVPPPSPRSDDLEVKAPVFGPSNKDDKDGKMTLVPSSAPPPPQASAEDDDFNRAIADSLMTASYHSASAQRDFERPTPTPRDPGAPLVLYSESGNSTYAAHLLQGLFAVPQLREAIMLHVNDDLDSEQYLNFTSLQELCMRMTDEENNYVEVDELLDRLRGGTPSQLPPTEPAMDLQARMIGLMQSALAAATEATPISEQPHLLFNSLIGGENQQSSTHVRFRRDAALPLSLHPALATVLWTPDSPNQTIIELSDILTVRLDWTYGAKRELWNLEERVVLDRFLQENMPRAMQIRAQQAMAQGAVKRLREKIESLSMHKGQNVHDSIKTLITHIEKSPSPPDEIARQSRGEMKQKLQSTLEALQRKVSVLESELEKETLSAGPEMFETDDPALNRHAYLLRAILMHDGALVAGSHLYVYIRQDDGSWWKIKDHEATRVQWEDITGDRTGLFMDGGPYIMLYSRDGARPLPVQPKEADLISFDEEAEEPEEVETVESAAQEQDTNLADSIREANASALQANTDIKEPRTDKADGDVLMQ